MELSKIVSFLDKYLEIEKFNDSSNNGLQVEGVKEIDKIAFAVDACFETFEKAAKINANLIVVHHGLIWGGIDYVRGILFRRLKFLIENGISLYAAHLPLDAHPEVGNNIMLLKMLNLKPKEPFGEYKGIKIGYIGEFDEPKLFDEIVNTVEAKLNVKAKVLDFGDKGIRRVAAVSGKGTFSLNEAIKNDVDLLITGEAEHEAYHIAKDGKINIIFAGHYTTETLGIKALMGVIEQKLDVDVEFIDTPTGF
ncbi:Nif3-like dinuclear metal center hexameric protein [Archaeoglobales archaeon]|nr:MAG: Nif3-like dinuclear metal center hexameric protein [Archaeoglobales archaeon]